ncbi:hypothetical protein POM88_028943 [Heracleum sosnowskyi]|uniref:Uncharacterized protein n=1 Tax=Heracleum sosnowskyi TaxID=360622 RepID=A0AAD8MEF6_9APIA|nr:hypothetical protein POM88_028943 [Heracleum sosnowskyi]
MWMRNQLLDYGLSYSKIPIYCDNQSAIAMTGNPVHHSLTKHISIIYHFIREQVLEGTIELHFVPTDQQIVDIFTKPLPEATFNKLDKILTGSQLVNPDGQTVISGITFATNNFVAVLDHQELPKEFHVIQDFLASSPLKYALTEPAKVSFKYVIQVWNIVVFGRGLSGSILMSFEYNWDTYHVTPGVVEEALHLPALNDQVAADDVILPICRITENNVKSLVNSDKANGFQGNVFIPDEVRLFLKEKMSTQYGSDTDAMGQGQTHPIPDPSIQPKHSLKQSTITSTVSQKTLVVKAKKSARSDVSVRQSGSKDFSSIPLTKKKTQGGVQGVLVKKADRVEDVVVKRKLILGADTDSEDEMPLSSKVKNTDGQTTNPDESSIPDAHANPDVSTPDASPQKTVLISDSPANASPTPRILEISWEKVAETASKVGLTPPLQKKRKADEIVFKRQKKLKGSSPQEPELQSSSAAIDDPVTQEPLTQSVNADKDDGMVTQETFSLRENEDTNIHATQEPSSQSKDAGKTTSVSKEFPDTAQGVSGANNMEILATQEPLVANTDASQSIPDSVAPDASGAPDAELILIQPLDSRPMMDPISDHQDKLKGVAITDPDHNDDSDESDDDNVDDVEKDELPIAIKSSLGTTHGSSSTFMAGKAIVQDFSGPSATDTAEQLRRHEWDNEWYRSADLESLEGYNTFKEEPQG